MKKVHEVRVNRSDPYCLEKLHRCTRNQFIKERTMPVCLNCGEERHDDVWICKPCDYRICNSCHTQVFVKCPFSHPLQEADPKIKKCSLCDNFDKIPCYACLGKRCNFSICLRCHGDDRKLKDQVGHPLMKSAKRT